MNPKSEVFGVGLAILIALLLVLACGCTSSRDWALTASTLRVEAGQTESDYTGSHGHRRFDSGGSYLGFSFAPLAYLEPAKEVVVRPALPEEELGFGPYFKAHKAVPDKSGCCCTCGHPIVK